MMTLLFLAGSAFAANNANIVLKNFTVAPGVSYSMEIWIQNTTGVSPSAVTHVEFNIANYGVMSDLSDFPTVVFEPRYNNGSGWVPRSTYNLGGGYVTYSFYQDGFAAVVPSYTSEKVCTVTFGINHPNATSGIQWSTSAGSGYGGGNGFDGHYNGARGYINATVSGYLDQRALPIQLASFRAVTLTGNSVSLTWATASEINNFGFEVQRSVDGKSFVSIVGSFVRGNGTTNQFHSYSYVDADPAGAVSYRLKQMDLDGTVNYTDPVQLSTTTGVAEQKPDVFALEQNFPNPFNPSTRIAFTTTKEGPVSLRVYDLLGREVALLVNENRVPGRYDERFDAGRLASGVYIYTLKTPEGERSSRMVLSK
jgi:hypothetical protein